MAAVKDFIKDNFSGAGGALNGAFAVAGIAAADNKLKALLTTLKDMVTFKAAIATGLAGAFGSLGKAIRNVIKDTGSLDAAMKRLANIQGFQKAFTPLVGGAEAAKKKVHELLTLAGGSGKTFAFESWAEAFKKMAIASRGTATGMKDMARMGDAAAATGNSLQSVTDVATEFYNTIRNGQPVSQVTNAMREMGVATQSDVDHLNALQAAGADSSSMLNELNGILDRHKGAMDSVGDSVAGVAARYEAAVRKMQEAAGESFTEAEVENQKNMTEAYEAVIPAIGRTASFLQKLTGGYSNAKSEVIKYIATSPKLIGAGEGAVKAIGVLVAILSTAAAVAIPFTIAGIFNLITAFTTFTGATGILATALTALRVVLQAMVVGGGLIAMVGLAMAVSGALDNFSKESQKAAEKSKNEAEAHRQAIKALRARAEAVKTLTEQLELMTQVASDLPEAEAEVARLQKKVDEQKEREESQGKVTIMGPGGSMTVDASKSRNEYSKDERDLEAAKAKRARLRQARDRAAAIDSSSLSPSELEKRRMEINRQISRDAEESERRRRSTNPADAMRADEAALGVMRKRGSEALGGANAAADIEMKMHNQSVAIQLAKANGASPGMLSAMERDKSNIGLSAPQSSSAFAATKVRQLLAAQKAEELRAGGAGQAAIDEQLNLSGGEKASNQMLRYWQERQAAAEEEEAKAAQYAKEIADLELDIIEKKRQMNEAQYRANQDLQKQGYMVSGDYNKAQNIEDASVAIDKYKELIGTGMDKQEAQDLAIQYGQNAIKLGASEDWKQNNGGFAVSSLQRIGGGGGVEAGYGSGMEDIAKRQTTLQEKMVEYLAKISEDQSSSSDITLK